MAGGSIVSASVAQLRPGRHTRRLTVTGCEEGCRLQGLAWRSLELIETKVRPALTGE
jgi:hypothetical protein